MGTFLAAGILLGTMDESKNRTKYLFYKPERLERLWSHDEEVRTPYVYINDASFNYYKEAWKNRRPIPHAPWTEHFGEGEEEYYKQRFIDTIYFPTQESADAFAAFMERAKAVYPYTKVEETFSRKRIIIYAPDGLQGKESFYHYPDSLKEAARENEYIQDTLKYLLTDIYLYDKEAAGMTDSIIRDWSQERGTIERHIKRKKHRDQWLAFTEEKEENIIADVLDKEYRSSRKGKEQYIYTIATDNIEKDKVLERIVNYRPPRMRDLFGLYAASMGLAMGGIALYDRRKHAKSKGTKDMLLRQKEKIITSNLLCLTGATGYVVWKLFSIPAPLHPQLITEYLILASGTVIGFQTAATAFVETHLDLQHPRWKNFGKLISLTANMLVEKDMKKKKDISDKLNEEVVVYPTFYSFEIMRKTNSFDEGFEQRRTALEYYLENENERKHNNPISLLSKLITIAANKKKPLTEGMLKLEHHIMVKNYHRLFDTWEQIIKNTPEHKPEMHALYAMFLESFNKNIKKNPRESMVKTYRVLKEQLKKEIEEDLSLDDLLERKRLEQWKRVLQEALNDPLKRLDQYEGKKTYIIGPSKFLSGVTIFKKSEEYQQAWKEYETAQRAKSLLDDEKILVASPITIIEYDNNQYYVSRMVRGIRYDMVEEQHSTKAYAALPLALAKIHKKMEGRKVRDLKALLLERSEDKEMASIIREHYHPLLQSIYADFVFEKDPQERNWFYDERENQVIAIDWDHQDLVPRSWELAKAFTNKHYHEHPEERKEGLRIYHKAASIPVPLDIEDKIGLASIGVAINTKLISPDDPRNGYLLAQAGKVANRKGYGELEHLIIHLAKS